MATYVDQPFYGWAHEDVSHQDESQEVSAPQMLDHGSISFGKFAYESLSWERRSVFTYNKCQEELEKVKSPGLVAKKKAYFEEYYKRIRAMKESQQNQQTELILDYGGDESISSQNGEEAEATVQQTEFTMDCGHDESIPCQNGEGNDATVQLESLGDGAANIVVGHSEEASVEISVEDVKKILQVQDRHLDLKNANLNLESLRSNSEDHEQEKNGKYTLQMQQLDADIPDNESLAETIEVTEQDDLSNLDKERDSRETSNSIKHIEPEEASKATELYTSSSKVEDLELKPAAKLVSEKITPDVRNHKGPGSVNKVKEQSAARRNGLKLEDKNKHDIVKTTRGPDIVKPSRDLKYASQRATMKSGNFAGSRKTSVDNVSRYYKSTSFPSNRPLTEVHASVTIPRPFSLATDRRAGQPGSSEGPVKSDSKPSNKRIPLAVHTKDILNVQRHSKKDIMTSNVQSRGLENKRGQEEKRKPLIVDRQHIGLKDRGGNVPGSPKTRSVNLPHSKRNPNIGIGNRNKGGIRADRQKEEKGEASLREVHRASTKVAATPAGNVRSDTKKEKGEANLREMRRTGTKVVATRAGNVRSDTKKEKGEASLREVLRTGTKVIATLAGNVRSDTRKVAPSWASNPPVSGRKLRFGEQSLDGKRPRQEKPRWR